MGITVEVLIAVFAVLLTISLAVERLIEMFRPLIEKIAITWQASVKIAGAILAGFGLAALFRFDFLKELGVVGISPIVGYILAGLVASTGSTTINRILDWLKTLKTNRVTTVTKTTSSKDYESDSTLVVAETIVAKGTDTVIVK